MSETTGPYDPNAVEGEKPAGNQYVSVKDLRVWAIALALLSVPMYFIYKVLEGNSERHRCTTNMSSVFAAINLYAEQHDNRFPPIARTQADGVTPQLSEGGQAYTWVSDVQPFLTKRANFVCPTATAAEAAPNEGGGGVALPSTYGMYVPYATLLTSLVEAPDQIVLIAETSNHGAEATSDPVPFGEGIPDGFAIGWSNSNARPDAKTATVTRLAFPGASKGATDVGRHGAFLQALRADGKMVQLGPDDASYETGGGVNPHWKLPPGYRAPGE